MKVQFIFQLTTFLVGQAVVQAMPTQTVTYQSSQGSSSSNRIKSLSLANRYYAPYGPDLSPTTTAPASKSAVFDGFGFGMSAVDAFAYDYVEKYMYIKSGAGPYVTVVDYSSFPPKTTALSLTLDSYNSGLNDVAVCPKKGLLFVSLGDVDKVLMFSTVKRSSPKQPQFIDIYETGPLTDIVAVNPDCTVLAVCNAVDDMKPAVTLVKNFYPHSKAATVQTVDFFVSKITDSYLLGRGAHMALTEHSMKYWDLYSDLASQLNWTSYRQNYHPGMFFDPAWFAWTSDGKTLYVTLERNNAVMRVNVDAATLETVDGTGLKSFPNGVDLVQDGGCDLLVKNEYLFARRGNKGFAAINFDGTHYLFTGDKGDDAGQDAYTEIIEGGTLFNGTHLGPKGFTTDVPQLFGSKTAASNPFNSNCQKGSEPFCSPQTRFSLGSAGIDYTNPESPVVKKMILMGGRGISLFKMPPTITNDEQMEFVWDSGSDFEVEGCKSVPWAHNGFVDETYSPLNGIYWQLNPDDRPAIAANNDPAQNGCTNGGGHDDNGACPMPHSIDFVSPQESGVQVVSLAAGIVCDRLFVLSGGNTNSDAFLYDASDIQNPKLIQVLNFSPASQFKSPGVAYSDATLGDIDPEHKIFVPADQSPTGKPGIIIGGGLSGTVSFYEFECTGAASNSPNNSASKSANTSSTKSLSSGAIAGISVVVVVIVLALALFAGQSMVRRSKSKESTEAEKVGLCKMC